MLSWLRKAWKAKSGLAAVEFALLAPIMIAFFLGGIELTDALACKQKVTGMAATAADLVAQETNVTNADISNVFSAINSIVYPYPTTGLKIVVSSLSYTSATTGTVTWSDAQNTTARVPNTTVTVPSGVLASGGSVILTEVTYPYTSKVAKFLSSSTNMTSTFYARPRRSAAVTRSAS
ncbi:MAG: TadE/TadG family type IV pilus assembly protein [Rhizomicrobium sp.]